MVSGRQRLTSAMDRLQVRPRYSSTAESDFSFEHALDGQTLQVDGAGGRGGVDSHSPAERGTADDANQARAGSSRSVAQVALDVAGMPSLDSDPHLKAAVSHAARQRTGLDSQTGLKCSWLDIYFHIPGTGALDRLFRLPCKRCHFERKSCICERCQVHRYTIRSRRHQLHGGQYLWIPRACCTAGLQDAQPFVKLEAVIPPLTGSHGGCAHAKQVQAEHACSCALWECCIVRVPLPHIAKQH